MKVSNEALFYAKILLFGEYGIIKDSMGLSIPLSDYGGRFQKAAEGQNTADSSEPLKKYLTYLQNKQAEDTLPCELDLVSFEEDLKEGYYFQSSIPQGFGVGSSGALVAAIYSRYAVNPIAKSASIEKNELIELKKILGSLESYFHGKSSGLDPLIAYLQLPVLIKSQEDLGTIQLAANLEGKGGIFLINSGRPGSTQNMVNIFLEKMKHEGFRTMLKDQFIKYNDACIKSFIKGEPKGFFRNLKQLSKVLLENFSPMIPEDFQDLWKKGIDSGDYYLKLCGSGGGGFILGFTQDYEKASQILSEYRPELIQRI
jgi:mevalonate kinase